MEPEELRAGRLRRSGLDTENQHSQRKGHRKYLCVFFSNLGKGVVAEFD
jgi:hypothetical protein